MITTEVQLISAAWCKRCHAIRPEVVKVCTIAGALLTYIDFDDLEEEDPLKKSVVSLPTIRMRTGTSPWATWTAATYEDWKSAVVAAAPKEDADF
jgi:thiol-disulfide isomerase/thioredoxin